MKPIIRLTCLMVLFNCTVAHASSQLKDVFTNNWNQIDKQLFSLIGSSEDTVVLVLGIPSAKYATKKSKFLEFTTHSYQIDWGDGVRLEAECKILVELQDKKVVKAITLNNHNYCAMGAMLPSFFQNAE